VVSPELALVDPTLAAWARARLPDLPAARLVALGGNGVHGELDVPVRRALAEGPRFRVPRRTVIAAMALVGVGFVFGSTLGPGGGSGTPPGARSVTQPQPKRPAATAAAGTVEAPSPKPAATSPPPAQRPAPAAAVTAPELVWAPAPSAVAYRVELYRGGRVVYAAVRRGTRLRLPSRLAAGTYRWVVWPLTGAEGRWQRGSKALVDASVSF